MHLVSVCWLGFFVWGFVGFLLVLFLFELFVVFL